MAGDRTEIQPNQEGRPLQIAPGTSSRRRRTSSALEIALEKGHHSLVDLLLCNGYDPNLEEDSPLDLALKARLIASPIFPPT